jgi:hypothetical protein
MVDVVNDRESRGQHWELRSWRWYWGSRAQGTTSRKMLTVVRGAAVGIGAHAQTHTCDATTDQQKNKTTERGHVWQGGTYWAVLESQGDACHRHSAWSPAQSWRATAVFSVYEASRAEPPTTPQQDTAADVIHIRSDRGLQGGGPGRCRKWGTPVDVSGGAGIGNLARGRSIPCAAPISAILPVKWSLEHGRKHSGGTAGDSSGRRWALAAASEGEGTGPLWWRCWR